MLLLLLGGVLLWPWLKTLPRRAVAHVLADRLEADVTLKELRFESRQRFILRGLTVDFPTGLPDVEHVFVDEVEVEAKLRRLFAGQLEVLHLRGVELRLRPAPPSLATTPTQPPSIARLHLESAQVTVLSMDGAEQTRFLLQAEVTDFGETAFGLSNLQNLAVQAENLALRPLAEIARIELPTTLTSALSDLDLEFRHSADGELLTLRTTTLHASLDEGNVQGEELVARLQHHNGTIRGTLVSDRLHGALGGFPFDLPTPTLAFWGQPKAGEDGLLEFHLEPSIRGLGQAQLAAVVHPSEKSWRHFEATILETRWQELWPALGFELTSTFRVVDDGQNLAVDLELRSPKIDRPAVGLVLEEVMLTLEGRTPHPEDLRKLPASFEIRSLAVTLGSGHLGGQSLPHHLQATGHLKAPQWPSFQAQILLSEVELFSDQPYHLNLKELRFDLASAQITDLSQLKLRALEASGELGLPPQLPLLPFTLHAAGHPLAEAGFKLDSVRLELPGLAQLQGSGRWRPTVDGGHAQFQLSELDLARWQALLGPENFAFNFVGSAAAELEGRLDRAGQWQLAGPFRLRDGGFTSTDGDRVMEGLGSDLELLVHGSGPTPRKMSAKGQAGSFVLLWGTFFGDFLDLSSQVEIQAEAGAGFSHWQFGTDLHLPGTFKLHAEVGALPSAPQNEFHYALNLNAEDLDATQRELLARFEGLKDLEVGGRLQLDATGDYRSSDQWSLTGALTLADLRLKNDQAAVDGLDLYLPLALEQEGLAFKGRRRLGDLRFNRLTVRDLEIPPLASALWVEADSFGLSEDLEIPAFGGRVLLERLGATHLLRDDRLVESGLRLEALDLARISAELEFFPLEGILEGDFPRMVLRGGDLEIDGGGRMGLFGGSVEIRDIRGKNLFTPFPELTLSTDLRDIDLGRLTRRIDFGEMTGILHGNIESCRLFRGVPVTCQASFQTEERSGVKRTVDIKAVNNLTILGTGQSTNVLDRGVQRFLKRFTYAALGVELHLADDVLRMRGLEKRGERELFLRGRLPFPIDIVNAQPGGAVSFQAMLRRFGSLDFSQVETEPP